MLDSTGEAKKGVLFHINKLSRKSNVTHLIIYNLGYKIATFLMSLVDDITKHKILARLSKIVESNIDLVWAAVNRIIRLCWRGVRSLR